MPNPALKGKKSVIASARSRSPQQNLAYVRQWFAEGDHDEARQLAVEMNAQRAHNQMRPGEQNEFFDYCTQLGVKMVHSPAAAPPLKAVSG